MNDVGMIVARTDVDEGLVAAVRAGDDVAFEELYARYRPRINAFVGGMLHDHARAEDVTQEAFMSALRRLRETDAPIDFKPWIHQIARNAAIDSLRRAGRAEEVSMDAGSGLSRADHVRLVDAAAPHAALIDKQRLDHLRGAFEELSDVQARAIAMREFDGLSLREISHRLHLSRPAVESALAGGRRRLESEYAELSEGRRCAAMRSAIVRLADGVGGDVDERRLARHARRCTLCRRRAREFGVEPLAAPTGVRGKIAALLPFHAPAAGSLGGLAAERAAAVAAILAIGGAGGVALQLRSPDAATPGSSAPEERRAQPRSSLPAPVSAPRGEEPGVDARSSERRRGTRQERRRGGRERGSQRLRGAPGSPRPAPSPAPAPSAAGRAPGPAGGAPPSPQRLVPDEVRSRLPVDPGALPVPQLPDVPEVQLPGGSGSAPGVQLPDPVPDAVDEVEGTANDTLDGALP